MHDLASLSRSSALTWLATSAFACVFAEESADPGIDSADAPIEEIIVTGTRLPMSATAPVSVLSSHDIERGGANSIGDALQALPMNAGGLLNTNVNMGGEPIYADGRGDGSVRVALRGHATLVLLNGRRFPNSGEGADASVDLNSLPVSLVERVEVLSSGASAVYGSDAVGGVVNIVTRRDLAGITLAGSRTLAEHGDGAITTGRAAAGLSLFGGNWVLGADHVEQEGVTLDRRDYSAVPLVIVDSSGTRALAPFGIYAPARGRFTVPEGNALGLAPGAYTRVEGATGQTAADWRPFDPAVDYFNVAPHYYSQTPNERGALWLIGTQPISEQVNLVAEALAHHRESTQQAAPDPYFGGAAPTLSDGSPGVPADHYYNPFGVDIVWPRRRMVELGNRGFSEDVDLWRLLLGLEGTIAEWQWNLSVAKAESRASTVETGVFFRSRIIEALGPSGPDGAGRIVCGQRDPITGIVPAAGIIPGCVPINLFSGAGGITREQLDYISPGPMRHSGTNEERTAELVLRGPWGQLSGRQLRWVVGAEYRRDAGSYQPDPQRVAEHQEPGLPTVDFEARELFAEAQLPLLHGRRWAREMDLNLGLRWSDYSSFDNHLSWQAGLHWQFAREWTLRANYADVFRAPGLWDLDASRLRIQGFDLDPCGNDPTPGQRANCAANGVPGGAYEQDPGGFDVVFGGNPELEPEAGHSIGAGLEYTPRWAEGLALSADFFYLEISNLIKQLYVDQVLLECAEHGLAEVCDDIDRFPDGSVKQVSTITENFSGLYATSGIDFAIDWAAATALGELSTGLLATYLERWDEQPFARGTVFEYAGQFDAGAMPRWRGLGTMDWQRGRWLAAYSLEYIGSYNQIVVQPPVDAVFEPYTRRIEPVLYHDLEGQYEFGNGLSVRAAITNITDEVPPFVNMASPANTDAGTYRLLGRSYFLELRYDFPTRRE